MAQINLLKQTSPSFELWQVIPKFFVRLLLFIFVVLVGYYGWLYISENNTNQKILESQKATKEAKTQALAMTGRKELLTRQLQLKSFDGLVKDHLYWSQLLPLIARSTYNKATYSGLKVAANGDLNLSVNVPDLSEMDRYLQVFDLPEVYKNFYDVKIGAYHKVQNKTSTTISFDVSMQYSKSIIQTPPPISNNQ